MGRHNSGKDISKGTKNPLDLMREQMDELMGANRNSAVGETSSESESFTDPNLDKFYLCGCSPYELLQGTKSDGLRGLDREGFRKMRSDNMRRKWEALPQEEKDKYGFERDLMDLLEMIVEEHDRRVAMLKDRYDRENAELKDVVNPELAREIESVKEQVIENVTQAEVLGEGGQVDDAMLAFLRATSLNARLAELERRAAPKEAKRQYVDEVSGLVYSSTDNESRIADLQAGRQYQAWKTIREKLLELRANPPPGGRRGPAGGRPSDDRRDERRRDDDPRRRDDRESDRGRGRDYDDRGRGRDYDRGPDRGPDRGREYDRGRDYGGRRDYDDRDSGRGGRYPYR